MATKWFVLTYIRPTALKYKICDNFICIVGGNLNTDYILLFFCYIISFICIQKVQFLIMTSFLGFGQIRPNRETLLASSLQRKFEFDPIRHRIQDNKRNLEKRHRSRSCAWRSGNINTNLLQIKYNFSNFN